ncbi:GTP binding protein [Crucibulum laeve]|uniref:GTP binding protein n=1 Tax=Crucibulum laeve TaxID=68775 RepID=A0A5C3M7Z4_9AGAR|nr:GTP binding protein [Crucibulum laeve]
MISSDHRQRHEELQRAIPQHAYVPQQHHQPPRHEAPDTSRPEFTLLVAGCRGGKTSFLRLLLDSSDIHPRASKDQLASVAKFVQGCSGHTSYIRTASIDINVDDANGGKQCLGLTLIDTPSLDFKDEANAERLLSETIRHIDSRFAEGIEDEWKAQSGDRYVHLCIYFLDPDQIIPPAVPGPPAPLVPRTRTNSFSQHEQEPVILEPPVTTNPLLFRPTLPPADITAIRRLSGRVNVLPVIARADILSNDRLNAVKVAIRRDLADAGIGFGIFDVDGGYPHTQDDLPPSKKVEPSNGYGSHPNGSSSNNTSPPTSPTAPPLMRLPYALVSPDVYSHSDGVPRIPLPRHELVQMYTPSPVYQPSSKIVRGKFLRCYRWGTLDVLDPNHSDFLPLRAAIFHHMETLQKYTREYLFDKFRVEYNPQPRPSSRHSISHLSHMGPIPQHSRPILAIDTAPHSVVHRHPSLSVPRDMLSGDPRSATATRPPSDSMPNSGSAKTPGARTNKQRSKKITVACNFCRSRKLKCDGGRPACSQCLKRSNPCDYMPQNKRRGTVRQRNKGDESESESGDERSADPEPSLSPEVPSQSLSRRSSHVDKLNHEGYPPTLPPMSAIHDRRDEQQPQQPMASSSRKPIPTHGDQQPQQQQRTFFPDNELPHIATLSLPEPSPSTPVPMSAPSLPPIRPASEQQAAQRKRASTVPGKGARQPSTSGPKVVACNFCRARKTKCDGAHPACASCARRQLPCNYVHDSGGSSNGGPVQKKGRRSSTSKPSAADSPHSLSPPSSRMIPTPSTGHDIHDHREGDIQLEDEVDLKRPLEHPEISRAPKKMRMDHSPIIAGIPEAR